VSFFPLCVSLSCYTPYTKKVTRRLQSSDGCYPTIDHKNSVFYGFMNNIPPEDISDISNLCITKRFINSSKNLNCYWKNNL
jgi:hypothetical protein